MQVKVKFESFESNCREMDWSSLQKCTVYLCDSDIRLIYVILRMDKNHLVSGVMF